MFIGGWEVRDAQKRAMRHLLIVPVLVPTFLFGPAGLLLYLTIRRFVPGKGPLSVGEDGGRGRPALGANGPASLADRTVGI